MTRLMKLDASTKQMTTNPPTDLAAAVAGLKSEVDGLAADTLALRQVFVTQNPTAQFVPQNVQALAGAQAGAATDPAKSAQRLADDLAAVTTFAKAQLPGNLHAQGYSAKRRGEGSWRAEEDATALQAALRRLAADTRRQSDALLAEADAQR